MRSAQYGLARLGSWTEVIHKSLSHLIGCGLAKTAEQIFLPLRRKILWAITAHD